MTYLFLADVMKKSDVQDLWAKYEPDNGLTDRYGGHKELSTQRVTETYVGHMDTGYHGYGTDYGPSYRDQTDPAEQDYGAQYGLRRFDESHLEPVKTDGKVIDVNGKVKVLMLKGVSFIFYDECFVN